MNRLAHSNEKRATEFVLTPEVLSQIAQQKAAKEAKKEAKIRAQEEEFRNKQVQRKAKEDERRRKERRPKLLTKKLLNKGRRSVWIRCARNPFGTSVRNLRTMTSVRWLRRSLSRRKLLSVGWKNPSQYKETILITLIKLFNYLNYGN